MMDSSSSSWFSSHTGGSCMWSPRRVIGAPRVNSESVWRQLQ